MNVAQPRAGIRGRRQGAQFDVGMSEQEPDELTPGVPARPGDGNSDHGA